MRTLKWFSMEWYNTPVNPIVVRVDPCDIGERLVAECFETEQQAFQWLETNGYITYEQQHDNTTNKTVSSS